MKVSDFDFYLPEKLIAQKSAERRELSKLFLYHNRSKKVEHKLFKDIIDYFSKGDLLVLNNSKVLPARVYGRKETGAVIEFLFLNEIEKNRWTALVKPAKRVNKGTKVFFDDIIVEITEKHDMGEVEVDFPKNVDVKELLNKMGKMPIPPYIKNDNEEYLRERYQTVFAQKEGSIAAPTSGLHFTEEILEQLKKKGVEIAYITLHVGIGTFRPVKVENILEHEMHSEYFEITEEAADKINNCKGKIFACGTTVTRTLEYVADEKGKIKAGTGWSDLFIFPGYRYKIVKNLITNFHLPKSTLIMLVAALIGKDEVLNLYKEAVEKEYRFFSFGDAMLILDD